MENRCLLIVKSMNENILLFLETNYCKNEIIRKQKHSNGKTKHKTIDRTLQKRSVVKMYFIIMINLEIKKNK